MVAFFRKLSKAFDTVVDPIDVKLDSDLTADPDFTLVRSSKPEEPQADSVKEADDR